MPRYYQTFNEVYASSDFETEMDKQYKEIMARLHRERLDDNHDYVPDNLYDNVPRDSKYSGILLDRGNGRVSKGLKSLELLALLCSGVDPSTLFLFDSVIYAGRASDFFNGSDEQLLNLVLINIGIDDSLKAIDNESFNTFKTTCLNIGKMVKSGDYTSDKFASYIRRECKNIINLRLQLKK